MFDDIVLEEETIAEERDADAGRFGAAILNQPIRALPTLREPVCVGPATSLRTAINGMNACNQGCVLVEHDHKLVGILTERDVLTKIVGSGIDLDRASVEQFMTAAPEALGLDDQVSYALNKMSVGGFRHIPLIDDEHRPVGVVSMRNVVDYMVELFRTDVLNLPPSPEPSFRERDGA